jgi:curli biogenesis system outer membrane secretion channel CsgG
MKMKITAAVCGLALCCTAAKATSLNDRFAETAASFAETGRERGLEGAALSVFPFQADEKLSAKKVDFAVGELLAGQLLRLNVFKITERAQLEEVLKEQKLGLSGAVDSRTAAGIGKLVGARLLVLGNVIRLGDSYQITAKLVDTETAEMLDSRITEVPVHTFDQEAGRYLVLVPDRQAIGIILGLGYGALGDSNVAPQTYDGTLTLTPGNASVPEGMGSIGIRYWPRPRWMVQLDYSAIFSGLGSSKERLFTANLTPTMSGDFKTGYTGFRLRLALDRTIKLPGPFTWHNGAGLAFNNIDNIDMDEEVRATYPDGSVVTANTSNNTKLFTPYLRTGVEWRPQERFGWSVFANLNLLSKDYEQGVTVGKSGSPERDITLWKVSLPRFYIDTSIALYF